MGLYIHKTTRHTVELDNGEQASVAVFAYKPYWGSDTQHVRSGAAACDRAASAGKREDWVVLGFQREDGKIEIENNAVAYKTGKIGSFSDGWFDRDGLEASNVLTVKSPCILTRTDKNKVGEDGNRTDYEYISYELSRRNGWVETSRSTGYSIS